MADQIKQLQLLPAFERSYVFF